MARHRFRTDSVDPCRPVRQVSEILELQAGQSDSPAGQAGQGSCSCVSHGSSRTIFRSCRTSRQGPTCDRHLILADV
jgi:hypothetical protein